MTRSRVLHEAYVGQVNIRVSQSLLDRIDAYVLEHSKPGLLLNRGDVVRILLEEALSKTKHVG